MRTLAAGLVAVGMPLAWLAPAGAQATLDRDGWWYKLSQQAVTGLLPVEPPRPPTVPEGGLYVANDPSDPVAISALRFHAPEAASGVLTLNLAPGTTLPTGDLIVACPSASSWGAVHAGGWESRPDADCDTALAEGEVSDDGTSVSWALTEAHKTGDAFDVVLRPAPDLPAPFQAPFEAPDDASFTPDPSFAPPPGPDFDDFDDFGDFDFDPGGFDEDFVFDDPPPFDAGPAPPPEIGDDDGDEMVTAPLGTPSRPAPAPVDENTAARILAVAVVGMIAAGLWKLSGVEAAAPRLIGGLAAAESARPRRPSATVEQVVGGIGRFARARTAPPTRF